MNRKIKRAILMVFDIMAILAASIFSYFFLAPYIDFNQRITILIVLACIGVYMIVAFRLRMFDKINRYTSIKETIVHGIVVTGSFFIVTFFVLLVYSSISLRFMFLSYAISVVLISGSRVAWRIWVEHQKKIDNLDNEANTKALRTLIVGAGEGGSLFIKSLKSNPAIELVGLVDDDLNKQKTTLFGIPVLGKIVEIEELANIHRIDQITVAIPSLSNKELESIVALATKTDAKVNQMPALEDIVSGKYEVNKFKEIDVIDLLGREEVKLDMERIAGQLAGQTILVSGAGGSIGSEICRQIVRFSPKRIVLLGHGEYSIYLINQELSKFENKDFELVPIIADIQDRDRIFGVMKQYNPDRVYHAAAHKHVPMMESNPKEAVKNNIYGTKNMAEAAKSAGVKSFVMVSTDKAVNPPNVMGATKRIAEMIVTGLNEKGKTNFVAVRFGNVLNSRGSVIPVFKDQIKHGGPITITDFRMTRYFMTIPEASRLVLQAGSLAKGGEIFVLDMGKPVKILDLAKKMIRLSGYSESEIPILETGIRPGEKLYEELLTNAETTEKQVFEKIFIGKVSNLPLMQVLEFVKEFENMDLEKLKNDLIAFANKDHSTNEFSEAQIVQEQETFSEMAYFK